jgi:hypothetical protein
MSKKTAKGANKGLAQALHTKKKTKKGKREGSLAYVEVEIIRTVK